VTATSDAVQQYEELAILIAPGREGRFYVHASAGAQSTSGEFTLPVPAESLPSLLEALSGAVRTGDAAAGAARDGRPVRADSTPSVSPREFGVLLYQALFRDTVLDLYQRTLASLDRDEEVGLRIRLKFDTRDPVMAQVMSLPWELLAPSLNDPPLAVQRLSPLVRALDTIDGSDPVSFRPPFRVLVIAANPREMKPLDLAAEEAKIRSGWGTQPSVRLDFMRGVFADVQERLAKERYHVVHFMGHGDFQNGEGVLLFENADGSAHAVDADALRLLLADNRTLHLVFLNACRTAQSTAAGAGNPFAGVATSLVKGGVRAVLAMQFPVTDDAALTFSQTFYRMLATGLPVDAAVSESRKAVFSGYHAEWATPVLFLRSSDGVLFAREALRETGLLRDGTTPASVEVLPPTVPATPEFTVFVATASSVAKTWYHRAITELPEHGITVVTVSAPPWKDHEPTIEAIAASADLFVHILGVKPGTEIEDAPNGEWYPTEQYRIGFESARSQLVFMTTGMSSSSVSDRDYGAFLQGIETCSRETDRLELITTNIDALVPEILAKRDRLLALRKPRTPARLYVDVHPRDREAAAPLLELLTARGCQYEVAPTGDALSPAEAMSRFQDAVRSVPLALVVAGAVDGTWVLQRLREGMKAAVDRDPPTRLVVVRLPDSAPLPPLPYYATAFGDERGYTPQAIETMLGLLPGALA
jgi:hypothetical protein